VVEGSHGSIIAEPRVKATVEILKRSLGEAHAEQAAR
jgi:hypothetical protein